MAVAMQYGNGSYDANSRIAKSVIYKGTIDDSGTVTLTLDAGGLFEIFTAEYNASTYAYRGHRARLVKMPEESLYGTVAAATINEAASSNSGVTITMNADSTITIKQSSSTYVVKYIVRSVDVYTGDVTAVSISGSGGGGGTGTVTQITFNGTVYYDDGYGNVTFDESDPVFTASDAYSITSTDISNWNSKADGAHTHTKSEITDFPTNVSSFSNDAGYLTSYTETDPVFTASPANTITSTDITNWNAKQDTVTAGNGIDITSSVISNTQGIEYIVGTQAAATNAWTGVSKDSSLKTGKIIAYYLPYAGNSSAATLQLTMADGTTTAAIALRRTSSSTVTTHFAAGNVIILIYDGTYWKVSAYYDANSNTIPTGYCTTAAATAAKSATCTYGYRDDANYFPCLFRYANTANNATLAIASYATTALPIYVNGARTSSSNTFGAGVILFLYYNSAYYCYNDGRFPIVVNGAVTSIQDLIALYTPTSSLATVATSGDYSDLSNTPSLATVATSGSYNDLSGTPTIPTALSELTDDLGSSPIHTHSQYLTSHQSLTDLGITATATELNYTDGVTSNIQDQLDAMARAVSFTATGAIASFVDGEGDKAFVDLVANIEPKQSGSGNPSPSNIRPITGFTGANVTRCGGNLLPDVSRNSSGYAVTVQFVGNRGTLTGTANSSGGRNVFRSEYFSLKAGTYYIKRFDVNDNGKSVPSVYVQNNTTILSVNGSTGQFTLSADSTKMNLGFNVTSGQEYNYTALFVIATTNISAYEPYQGTTLTVDWSAEAGTVYGGTIDVATGLLTVTNGYIASYNGEALPSTWISDRDVYSSGTTPTTGAEVVYKLATPQTYQLTPQDAYTLFGTNNVWADTGDVTVRYIDVASDYFVDKSAYKNGQLLQNKNLAYVESGTRASRAYSVNNYFINADGVLCRITASVSSGGTLVKGTNYIVVTGGLANDLYSLLS